MRSTCAPKRSSQARSSCVSSSKASATSPCALLLAPQAAGSQAGNAAAANGAAACRLNSNDASEAWPDAGSQPDAMIHAVAVA